MKTSLRMLWRSLAALAGIATMLVAWACIQRPMKVARPNSEKVYVRMVPASSERDVDMLFVIDNSNSMSDEQTNLSANFPMLMQVLKKMAGGLPNVHLGVATTDVGMGPYTIGGCETPNGDDGLLQNGGCAGLQGAYIVDVEPKGCEVVRDPQTGTCSSHNCGSANCSIPGEPSGLALVEDEFGCPRCRNYGDQKLEDVFSCVARSVGINGCGFEQPFESMKRALSHATEPSHDNYGFTRNNSYLSVFFISDEDDCSAENTEVFTTTQTDINSTFGPLDSYRCYEFGVVCDEPWDRTAPEGTVYHNCRPIEAGDPKSGYIASVESYVSFLKKMKDPDMTVVAAIAGPFDGTIKQVRKPNGNPAVAEVCMAPGGDVGADPAVRIKSFVEEFNQPEDMSWAYTSVCAADYTSALQGLGNKLKTLLDPCVSLPLKGCPDPNHVLNTSQCSSADAQAEVTGECAPQCTVMQRVKDENGDLAQESKIPYCGDVGVDVTTVNGTTDPNLPVDACWYVKYSSYCDRTEQLCLEMTDTGTCVKYLTVDHYPSRGAEIVVVRKQDAPPRTSYMISCSGYSPYEQLCNDGVDDDGDCLIDMDDPDCAGQNVAD